MKTFSLLFVLLLILGGCSSKNANPTDKNIQVQETERTSVEEIEDDEFEEFAEFSEEMEVESVYDPLSGYNRVMTDVNDKIYVYLLTPIAKGYKAVVHYEIRNSVRNFFHNIIYPVRLVNNLLQGKFKNATEETGRFLVNSTIGIAGLFDPAASEFNLQAHNEDFGQTLGFYGVGSGVHIVLPILGPSNLRDIIGLSADYYLSPINDSRDSWYTLTDNFNEYLAVKTFQYVNEFSLDTEIYENIKKDAVDLYPYLRDVYEQRRKKQIEE